MSISSVIKSLQDIMRKDAGVDGDAQRLGQLSWLLFLKILIPGRRAGTGTGRLPVPDPSALLMAQLGGEQ